MVSALWAGRALAVLRILRYRHRLLTQDSVVLEFLSCGVRVIRIINLLCCAELAFYFGTLPLLGSFHCRSADSLHRSEIRFLRQTRLLKK